MSKPIKRTLIVGTVLIAGGLAGAAAVQAGGEDERSVSGPKADAAIVEALKITGGGTANSVELDGENGATWEVEVTKPNGATVDVRLDGGYGLVIVEGDGEGDGDGD